MNSDTPQKNKQTNGQILFIKSDANRTINVKQVGIVVTDSMSGPKYVSTTYLLTFT